jgi:hypothetical protein
VVEGTKGLIATPVGVNSACRVFHLQPTSNDEDTIMKKKPRTSSKKGAAPVTPAPAATTTTTDTPATGDTAAPAPAPAKPAALKQNGIKRPDAGSATGKLWDIADEISRNIGRPAPRGQVIERYMKEQPNANKATAATQYARWVTFHDAGEALKAGRKAEAEAKAKAAADEKARKAQEKAAAQAAAAAQAQAPAAAGDATATTGNNAATTAPAAAVA